MLGTGGNSEEIHSLEGARVHFLQTGKWVRKEEGASGRDRILNSEAWEAPKEVGQQT